MFSPSEIAAEIRVLVDTFIIRWNINQDVANKLLRSHPEVQWRVISNQVPRCVHNPNGFVMSRIIKATHRRSDLPSASEDVVHGAMQPDDSSAKSGHANRSRSSPWTLFEAFSSKQKSSEVVEVAESSPPLPERSPSTPMADYNEGSDGDKGPSKTLASKTMPKNNCKGTTLKEDP